jgi:hypothetical protein
LLLTKHSKFSVIATKSKIQSQYEYLTLNLGVIYEWSSRFEWSTSRFCPKGFCGKVWRQYSMTLVWLWSRLKFADDNGNAAIAYIWFLFPRKKKLELKYLNKVKELFSGTVLSPNGLYQCVNQSFNQGTSVAEW